jgi:hypothetical protein
MAKRIRNNGSTADSHPNATKTDILSRLVDRFEELSTGKALGVTLLLALAMVLFVYQDFIFGNKVLLYTDIGSDAVNFFYLVLHQQASLWQEHALLKGFTLETAMGGTIVINPFDVFQWIIIAGGPDAVASNIAYAEMLKSLLIAGFGTSALLMFGMRRFTSLIGGLCLGFAGYVALGASGWYVESTSMFCIVLALWAVEFALSQRRLWYIITPLAIALTASISSFLIIYITAGLLVYLLIRTFSAENRASNLVTVARLLGAIVIGLFLSFSAIETTITTLTQSGRAEALKVVQGGTLSLKKNRPITELVERTELTNVVQRAYSTNAMGVGNTFKGMGNFLEAPLLYLGLPMLLFFPLYGMGRSRKEKMLWGAMLGAVLIMLIFPWFRYAFWGFKLDYFREFTMLIGIFLLVLAMMGLDRVVRASTGPGAKGRGPGLFLIGSSVVMLLLPFVFAKPIASIDTTQRMTSAMMLLLLSGSALCFVYTRRSAFLVGFILVTIIDLSMNAHATINKRALLTRDDIRNGKLYSDASVQALKWIRSNDADLYRAVKYFQSGPAIHPSLNDAMIQHFNGLVGYQSTHNKYYLRFMTDYGCVKRTNPDEAKWVSRIVSRPFLASGLGARYFLTRGKPFGFHPDIFPIVHRTGDIFVHRSLVALPIFLAYNKYVTPTQLASLDNAQKDFLIYNAVSVEAVEAKRLGLTPFDLKQANNAIITPASFMTAAAERCAAMTVSATSFARGLSADVRLRSAGLVVASIPFTTELRVLLDGKEVQPIVVNSGFFGIPVTEGSHRIVLELPS